MRCAPPLRNSACRQPRVKRSLTNAHDILKSVFSPDGRVHAAGLASRLDARLSDPFASKSIFRGATLSALKRRFRRVKDESTATCRIRYGYLRFR